jgi:hypothetical protein
MILRGFFFSTEFFSKVGRLNYLYLYIAQRPVLKVSATLVKNGLKLNNLGKDFEVFFALLS